MQHATRGPEQPHDRSIPWKQLHHLVATATRFSREQLDRNRGPSNVKKFIWVVNILLKVREAPVDGIESVEKDEIFVPSLHFNRRVNLGLKRSGTGSEKRTWYLLWIPTHQCYSGQNSQIKSFWGLQTLMTTPEGKPRGVTAVSGIQRCTVKESLVVRRSSDAEIQLMLRSKKFDAEKVNREGRGDVPN